MSNRAILTLVRHGETGANLEGIWQGSIDAPLNERGRAQASRVAAYLGECCADATALYSSPLQRAYHTAEVIAETVGLAPQIDEALTEYHLGTWEGKTYEDLRQEHRFWHHIKHDPDFAPHGGESPRQVTDRVSGALLRIARSHPGERVIVVAHGGAFSLGLGHLLAGGYDEWQRVMDNCAVSELVVEPRPELLSYNLTDHLEDL
jgi:broad specificity phosphatase PhoE